MKQIRIILEKSSTGYSAYSPDFDGIFTAAPTFEEVQENIKEVIEAQAEYLLEKGETEKHDALVNATIDYQLDIQQFFDHYAMINKSAFADYIGMNASQLRKISKGIVSLSDEKALQIQKGLHKLAEELRAVHFA